MKKNNNTDKQLANIEEGLTKTEQFIEDNRNILMSIIGAIIIVFIVIYGYKNFYKEPRNQESQNQLFIGEQHFEKGEFRFNLSGTETYGLDKSFMNAIRRVLLTDIPTVAFRVDENKEKDITINTNSGSIHNEILIQRIGLLPLYINPDNYTKNYFTMEKS